MTTFPEDMQIYHQLLQQGALPRAYSGLLAFMQSLRVHFQTTYPDSFVSGSLYPGTMDMTYFSFTPPSLKLRNLKIAIVFLHQDFRFEIWLSGANRQVQADYWQLFKEKGWNAYPLVASPKSMDAILTAIAASEPDFRDLAALTHQIESESLRFSHTVEAFLSSH